MARRDRIVRPDLVRANPQLRGLSVLEVFDAVIEALASRGLLVILDNHLSRAGWAPMPGDLLWFDRAYGERAWIRDWRYLASRYGPDGAHPQPYVVGTDLRNEPAGCAHWGGPARPGCGPAGATDWRRAATVAGNAVLAADPSLLILVEGVAAGKDLSAAGRDPVILDRPGHVVYSAHDYAMDHRAGSTVARTLDAKWGHLLRSSNAAPVWVGEFGADHHGDGGRETFSRGGEGSWFRQLVGYLSRWDVDWSYWPLNGTNSTAPGQRTPGEEAYGLLDPSWTRAADPRLLSSLAAILPAHLGPGLADRPMR